MARHETEQIDKLFLELSQFTTAITWKEQQYRKMITKALEQLKGATPQTRNGPCIQAMGTLQRALEFRFLPDDISVGQETK